MRPLKPLQTLAMVDEVGAAGLKGMALLDHGEPHKGGQRAPHASRHLQALSAALYNLPAAAHAGLPPAQLATLQVLLLPPLHPLQATPASLGTR